MLAHSMKWGNVWHSLCSSGSIMLLDFPNSCVIFLIFYIFFSFYRFSCLTYIQAVVRNDIWYAFSHVSKKLAMSIYIYIF